MSDEEKDEATKIKKKKRGFFSRAGAGAKEDTFTVISGGGAEFVFPRAKLEAASVYFGTYMGSPLCQDRHLLRVSEQTSAMVSLPLLHKIVVHLIDDGDDDGKRTIFRRRRRKGEKLRKWMLGCIDADFSAALEVVDFFQIGRMASHLGLEPSGTRLPDDDDLRLALRIVEHRSAAEPLLRARAIELAASRYIESRRLRRREGETLGCGRSLLRARCSALRVCGVFRVDTILDEACAPGEGLALRNLYVVVAFSPPSDEDEEAKASGDSHKEWRPRILEQFSLGGGEIVASAFAAHGYLFLVTTQARRDRDGVVGTRVRVRRFDPFLRLLMSGARRGTAWWRCDRRRALLKPGHVTSVRVTRHPEEPDRVCLRHLVSPAPPRRRCHDDDGKKQSEEDRKIKFRRTPCDVVDTYDVISEKWSVGCQKCQSKGDAFFNDFSVILFM